MAKNKDFSAQDLIDDSNPPSVNMNAVAKNIKRNDRAESLRRAGERLDRINKLSSKFGSTRRYRERGRGALALVAAFGARLPRAATRNPYHAGKGQGRKYDKPGRPTGTYKYGMPIQEWKKLKAKKKALERLQNEKQYTRLRQSGYQPEEIREIERKKVLMQTSRPVMSQSQLEVERQFAESTVSPNTQAMLQRIDDIHKMGERADIRMQRIKREQRMIADATSILKTPNMFKKNPAIEMNILDTENSILSAPNVFKENPEDNIIRTKRFNIMQTKEAGNNLKFF